MRINLWAGPSAAKTTTAADIFKKAKRRHFSIEQVREFCKDEYVYDNKPTPIGWYQLDCFNGQLLRELKPLTYGVKNIVTDSPLMMQVVYACRAECSYSEELLTMAKKFDNQYPSVNIFLDRTGINFEKSGRYENLQEAIEMDNRILSFLSEQSINYISLPAIDEDAIINFSTNCLE